MDKYIKLDFAARGTRQIVDRQGNAHWLDRNNIIVRVYNADMVCVDSYNV